MENFEQSYMVDAGATLMDYQTTYFPMAFVVHAYDGSRIACALVVEEYVAPIATGFVPYFNYAGNLSVSGLVTVASEGLLHYGSYTFEGLDPDCAGGAGDLANSCGIHIHSGMTCTGDAAGHFWTGNVTSDPWINIAYTYTPGYTTGTFELITGAYEEGLLGRAFVVHAYDGSRIACAILQ